MIMRNVLGVAAVGSVLLGGALGCNQDRGVAPSVDSPATTLGTIQASPLNAIIAVGQTVQIGVTGATLSGAPITTFDSVVYMTQSTTDSIRVQLSPSGLVTGRASSGSTPVLVNVFAFKGGLVRADQVIIQVTPTAVAGVTLSIQPTGSDSAKLARGSSKTITPVIRNSSGTRVNGAKLRYIYHDSDAAKMGCYTPRFPAIGDFTAKQLGVATCGRNVSLNQIWALTDSGTAWVIADAMVYGAHLRDSVQYTLTNPYSLSINVVPQNLAINGGQNLMGTPKIAPGGTVHFVNGFDPSFNVTVDFIFADPSAATVADPAATYGDSVGNVIDLPGGQQESPRRFWTAGRYSYTAVVHGGIPPFTGATVTGEIIVQ